MENNKDYLKEFLIHLADRKSKENDISDVLYSVLQMDMDSLRFFVNFFFGQDCKMPELIYREEYKDQSRVDLSFKTKSRRNLYIVEVKKWDGNHHFDYNKTFNSEQFGYITDYDLTFDQKKECESKNISYKTWSEFSREIQTQSAPYPLFAFNEYIKLVCNMREIRKMNLLEVTSLVDFSQIVEQIISSRFSSRKFISKKSNMKPHYYGWYCSEYIWFGLIFEMNPNKREPFVAVTIDEYGYKNVDLEKLHHSKTKLIGEIDFDKEKTLVFPLKLIEFEKFNKMENVDKQKELLNEFFQECLDLIEEQKIADIK
ncbi:hypothetical protein [Leptospira levettii]|uniref:PD-(D/E)XK nuclease family protein n=1 Tax=Leptospira levettii TaxID=2023178 RepID=A0AAW5VFU7_9LEPT|nr:hypothetical protein [Leptospira levettii]MCW7512108.1 hypothetical protein [Leptospira levettii]MCW7517153.1 hypothetical protein [Leptospira levettii]